MKGRNTGTSIEYRSKEIDRREVFGHWEMGTVVGGAESYPQTLSALSESKSYYQLILKMKDRTQKSVIRAMSSMRIFVQFEQLT
ncbi:MAG: hypothetical protein HQ557_16990 [Bacteroidetes bacterium]|nr:hypothetical protein [Bacteroidota bacterium]